MTDNWYTVSEAANMLNISTETVRRYIRSGKLEGRKDGKQWMVKLEDVGQSRPQMTDNLATPVATDAVRLKFEKERLEERNRMLQDQIDMLRERIKELEADKGFLLDQLKEKDKIINELMPRALPKPKTKISERLKRLFGRKPEQMR